MAPSLPGLPTELLLKIIQHPYPYVQISTYIALRATCRELNEKLVYYFDSEYFDLIKISLSKQEMLQLHAISKGHLATHVTAVEVDVSILFKHVRIDMEEESTDASRCSWFGKRDMDRFEWSMADKFYFDEDVADFIATGTCSQLLGEAMSGLPNVTSLVVYPPTYYRGMVRKKLKDLKSRWLVACKALLWVFFTKATAAKKLDILSENYCLPVPLSALDFMASYPFPGVCLEDFHIDFMVDVEEGSIVTVTGGWQ